MMVDIIKLPSNRPFFEQITVPMLYPNVRRTPQSSKQWFGRCLGDPPRQYNMSDLPHLHRNVIDRELYRCYSTTVDMSTSMKIKPQQQRSSNREPLKATTVTSDSILSNVDETDSRLFDALSQHFTVKAEPLRPVNNFINNSTNTLSSWQKYWVSTKTQRQREKTKNSELRSKRDHPGITTPHFVTIRDPSSHIDPENNIPSSTFITKPASPVLSDKQYSSTKEEDQFTLPPLVPKTSPMNSLKSFENKPLSNIQSECTITNNDNNEMNSLSTKMYKLPLPIDRPKTMKSILKIRSKSLERKPMTPSRLVERKETKPTTPLTNAPVIKRKNPTPSNKSHRSLTKKQQQSLSTVITTTPRSKYEPSNWDEPYVGVRYDPPTPPSSPSYFPWSQVNDQYENETSYKLNYIDEIYL